MECGIPKLIVDGVKIGPEHWFDYARAVARYVRATHETRVDALTNRSPGPAPSFPCNLDTATCQVKMHYLPSGEGVALTSTVHPGSPWYRRFLNWLRPTRLSKGSLETVEISVPEDPDV